MDLLWLFAEEMKSTCHVILSLLNDTSTVVNFLMMTQKHMIEQTLSLHSNIAVDSHFLLSTPPNRQYPVSQLEEELMCVVGNDGDLFVGPALSKDGSKQTQVIKEILLVEDEIVNVVVESTGEFDTRLMPFIVPQAFLINYIGFRPYGSGEAIQLSHLKYSFESSLIVRRVEENVIFEAHGKDEMVCVDHQQRFVTGFA